MATQNSEPDTSDKLDAQAWKIIAVVILAPFMSQIDSTVVNVSFPAITQDLQSTIATAQWIISGYLIALAIMLPIHGWLVDRIGAKRLYLLCFSTFTLASFLCGASTTMNQLIAARILQGMAGGLLAPLTQLMVARVAGSQMVKVMGISAMPLILAPMFGPILAGIILKRASWSWIFYINLPLGLFAIILAMIFIPHDEELIQKRDFDLKGFLMISPAMVCLLFGFESASHHEQSGIWFLIAGVLLFAVFILHAAKAGTHALIDIHLFKIRIFTVATLTQFLSSGIMYASQFLIPLYLIKACRLSASEVGWTLATMGIGMLCIYPLVHRFTEKFGIRAVAAGGIALNLLGTLPFLWMTYHDYSITLAITALFIRGFGQGAAWVPSMAAIYSCIPKEKLSLASTAVNIVQRLGGPIMTTGLAIVVSTSEHSAAQNPGELYAIPFIALLLLQTLALGISCQLPHKLHYNQN
jgi:EmrB/QacA subfamily drug resistance transporter